MEINRARYTVIICVVCAILWPVGCAVYQPWRSDLVTELHVPQPIDSAFDTVLVQARKCWAKSGGLFSDTIYVENASKATQKIVVGRYGSDIGKRPPFLILDFRGEEQNGTIIVVSEGSWEIDALFGGWWKDIEPWLLGDTSCVRR